MSKRESYLVRIAGLGTGKHVFSFGLDRSFFDSFEHAELEEGNVEARIVLEKEQGLMTLQFELEGRVEVVCDRCLEPFMIPVRSSEVIYLKEGEENEEVEDNVMVIGKDTHEIEVGQLLYEFIMLALPVRKVHEESSPGHPGCNPEMIEKLNAHTAGETGRKSPTDPRWDALKGIIEKNS